jgi:glycosyltransferase involved in cell wall biosynthesis
MPKRRLAEILGAADVGLMLLADVPAFYYGTSPNKFFDYISAGLPVLNNYPGWLAGLIEENQCGIAVPPGQPEVFADALEKLSDDADRCCEMGRQARRLAEQRFDRLRLAAEFVNLLESVRQGGLPNAVIDSC